MLFLLFLCSGYLSFISFVFCKCLFFIAKMSHSSSAHQLPSLYKECAFGIIAKKSEPKVTKICLPDFTVRSPSHWELILV